MKSEILRRVFVFRILINRDGDHRIMDACLYGSIQQKLISACHLERRLELAKTEVETRRATTEWSDLAVSRLRNSMF